MHGGGSHCFGNYQSFKEVQRKKAKETNCIRISKFQPNFESLMVQTQFLHVLSAT